MSGYHISRNGNLCQRTGHAKNPYFVVYDTSGLGDRCARKQAAMIRRAELEASQPSPNWGFHVVCQLPGVMRAVRLDITIDVPTLSQ